MRGYWASLLIWFDVNLSVATRSARFLEGEKGEFGEARADEEEFVLGVELRGEYFCCVDSVGGSADFRGRCQAFRGYPLRLFENDSRGLRIAEGFAVAVHAA